MSVPAVTGFEWQLPAGLRAVLDAIRRRGRPLLVGGCVRDWLAGQAPKDFDVEVYGLAPDELQRVLAEFGDTDPVGKSFGVIKLRLEGREYDISLPRRETKTGAGHRGFEVGVDPALPVAQALARRDFTVNSIAWDPFAAELIDPHGGAKDFAARTLRHTSEAFVEDPLRVLRGMQFAGRFDLRLAPETAALCASIVDTFRELPRERVWGEWQKWASLSSHPSAGLRVLWESEWLVHFPELAALDGVPQDPEWHPEGDVFVHTCHCVDALASFPEWRSSAANVRRDVMLAVLAHDFGKPATTIRGQRNGVWRWISPGHEPAGGPLSEQFLVGLGAPMEVPPLVRKLVENHMAHLSWPLADGPTASLVRRMARRVEPATLEQLLLVLRADHLGRPPLVSADSARRIAQLRDAMLDLAVASGAPKPLLLGRHLITRGLQPGPEFRAVLDEAFEAQLDGQFEDEAGAQVWLGNWMTRSGNRDR